MTGTNRDTGKAISGLAYLRQCITDVLTTPVGSRVLLRDYGSRLPELVDAPANSATIVQIYYETAFALKRWLSSLFKVSRVVCSSIGAGQIVLSIEGTYTPDGSPITLDGISIA